MKRLPFTIHAVKGQISTTFLIEYPDRILLLDGGARSDVRRLVRYITHTLGRPIDDLKLAVVTHMHPDHAGGAPILRRRFGVPIAAHGRADDWYAGITGWLQHKLDTIFAWLVAMRKGQPWRRFWYPRLIAPQYALRHNDRLPFFPDWEVLFTPGHTAHDVALYHRFTGTLYAGDLVLKVNDQWFLPYPITMPAILEHSLRRLAKLRVRHLLMAHGGICESPPGNLYAQLRGMISSHRRVWSFRIVRPLMMLPRDIRRFRHDHEYPGKG